MSVMDRAAAKNRTRQARERFARICLTGGPGAGKTSLTEIVRREFSGVLAVVPETATILYGGGLPRPRSESEQRLIQSAIYNVQIRSEALFFGRLEKDKARGIVCDRGTLDCGAYWPGGRAPFLRAQKTDLATEFGRYDLVIHLESAAGHSGYDLSNPVRVENAPEALRLDRKILQSWSGHPNTVFIPSRESFLEKSEEVLALIRQAIAVRP